MSNEVKNPSEVKGMKVRRLSIDSNDYYNPKIYRATVNLTGKGDTKEITIELDEKISNDLMRFLNPILLQRASEAAQSLADEAKSMANALSDCITESLKQVENKNETTTN